MGDRVSIQIKGKCGELSPILFSHWGGVDLANESIDCVKQQYDRGLSLPDNMCNPVSRGEASAIFANLVSYVMLGKMYDSEFRILDKNSSIIADNGLYIIYWNGELAEHLEPQY